MDTNRDWKRLWIRPKLYSDIGEKFTNKEIHNRRLSRDFQIWRLIQLGWTQTEVGKVFGLEHHSISGIVKNFGNEIIDIQNQYSKKNTHNLTANPTTHQLNRTLGEYLNTDDPIIKDCEIALQDFTPILDHAKDEVLYVKVKPEDKTIIYHLTPHPDSQNALREISLDAKKHGFTMVDSRVHIQQAADMLKKKLAGTLKMKKGRHPGMDYLQ